MEYRVSSTLYIGVNSQNKSSFDGVLCLQTPYLSVILTVVSDIRVRPLWPQNRENIMTAKEMTITRIDQAIRQLRFVRDQADMSLDSLTAVRESISANDAESTNCVTYVAGPYVTDNEHIGVRANDGQSESDSHHSQYRQS